MVHVLIICNAYTVPKCLAKISYCQDPRIILIYTCINMARITFATGYRGCLANNATATLGDIRKARIRRHPIAPGAASRRIDGKGHPGRFIALPQSHDTIVLPAAFPYKVFNGYRGSLLLA